MNEGDLDGVLITEEQLKMIETQPNPITEYSRIVQQTTTATAIYNHAIFFGICSALFCDKVQIDFKPVNLYISILGHSSTYKTTALTRALDLIGGKPFYGIAPLSNVVIQEPATAQGVRKLVQKANGKSILLYTDEVQSFIERSSQDTYKGILPTLNLLYDGRLIGQALVKDLENKSFEETQKSQLEANCTTLFCGILSKVTQALSDSALSEGVVQRFLWAVNDLKNPNFVTDTKYDEEGNDNIFDWSPEIMLEANGIFRHGRNWVDKGVQTLAEKESKMKKVNLRLTKTAKAILGQAEKRFNLFIEKNYDESYFSFAKKLFPNIERACALLSCVKCEFEISDITVLQCLQQSRNWALSYLKVHELIIRDQEKAVQENILDELRKYGGVRASVEIYKKFYHTWDSRSLKLLKEQGRIDERIDSTGERFFVNTDSEKKGK